MFKDRADAGKTLAMRLRQYEDTDAVVLAIPRGGVVVGYEVAKALDLKLDVVIPRKIGAPGNPELAIGAVVTRDHPIINHAIVEQLNIPVSYIEQEIENQLKEIERRRRLYIGTRPPHGIEGRVVLLVDDGLATGYTALAAIRAVKQENPGKLVLAVPVAPRDTYELLKKEVDEIVCVEVHELFFAVGQFYEVFTQTTDEEVTEMLSEYR